MTTQVFRQASRLGSLEIHNGTGQNQFIPVQWLPVSDFTHGKGHGYRLDSLPGDSADVPGDLSRDLTTSPQRGGKGEETRPGKEIHLPHFSVFPVNLSFHLLNYQTGTKARGEGKRRPAQCYTCSQSQGGRRKAKVAIHLGCASHGCLGSRHILMAQRRRQPEAWQQCPNRNLGHV